MQFGLSLALLRLLLLLLLLLPLLLLLQSLLLFLFLLGLRLDLRDLRLDLRLCLRLYLRLGLSLHLEQIVLYQLLHNLRMWLLHIGWRHARRSHQQCLHRRSSTWCGVAGRQRIAASGQACH